MNCPKCGGETWDNRPKKATGEFSAKSPDFKCKDKECGGVIWPDKAKAAAKAPAVKQNYVNTQGFVPSSGAVDWPAVQRDYAALLYTAAHAFAKALGCEVTDVDQRAIQQGAATLLIQLEKQGHKLGTLAPPKPKAPTKEELSEFPPQLREPGED